MPNYNKVQLMGNLTRDPELRVTPKGTPVCAFGMAINRVFRDDSGGNREETTFVDVEAWGRQAEVISKYVTKGGPLFVEGRLKLDTWESKEGEKRSKLKVVLENMQLLGGGSRGESSSSSSADRPAQSSTGSSSPKPSPASPASDDIEEDVPF
ncbi:single-stranded DNA-binding protein [Puniceicoccaceae bacterium K14]|nr:single-stranded DNA-binding protein [Puniceicoccaceae bacterium K14]